jgi:hypothetical protein
METLDFVLWMAILVIGALLVNRYISMKQAVLTKKFQKDLQHAAEMQKHRDAQRDSKPRSDQTTLPDEEQFDVGPWVPQLLESFGIDPETIYEEEMPADLKAFMPMIKAYVGVQGGLPGIMQKMKDQSGGPPGSGDGTGL